MLKSITGKKIFITGGAGFIGSHLTEELILKNKIVIYDNLHRNALKFTQLAQNPNLELIKGDVLDLDHLAQSIDDCDIVIHLAAIAGVENVIVSADKTLDVNLMGTYNLLKAINGKSKKIERFIFFSTSEVYGPFIYRASENGMTTQGVVSEPRWSYAVSKIAGEHWVYAYFHRYGLPAVIIRPFNIYGERQVGEGAIHKFIEAAIKNQPIKIFSHGTQIRSWCHVEDMVAAIMSVLDKKEAIGQVYNVGNPEGTATILELGKLIKKIAQSDSKIIFSNRDYPDVELRVPDIIKAEKELDYHPKIDLAEGLARTIKWYRKFGKVK